MKNPIPALLKLAVFYWLPAVSWMAFVFFVSSVPGKDLPDIGLANFDKLMHAAEYIIMGVLLARAVYNSADHRNLTKVFLLSIIIAVSFAVIDEIHQRYIPDRAPDLLDLVADLAGIVVGTLLYKRRIEVAKD